MDRDVIAVDLPGHGDSARQPKGVGSASHDLAVAVAELFDELDLSTVHVAGNSSGGWVALELGRLQRARTVTALDPAVWRKSAPRHIRVVMRQVRLTAKITRRVAPARGLIEQHRLRHLGRPGRVELSEQSPGERGRVHRHARAGKAGRTPAGRDVP